MTNPTPTSMHPQLIAVISKLRSMVRKVIVADFVLTVMVVLGLAFWGGLLLDYGPILLGGLEMPRSARVVLLIGLIIVLAVIAFRLLGSRLARKLPDESLALLLERQHPELGERLMTSVQLARADANPDAHARPLFEHVRHEAVQMSDSLDVRRVFQWKPLIQKAIAAGVMLVAVIAFSIVMPSIAGQAFARLLTISDEPWPRRAKLEMVGVEVPVVSFADPDDAAPPQIRLLAFEDRELRLPKGGKATLRVRAQADNREVPDVCTVHYTTASGQRGQANMRRVGARRDGYQEFSLDGPPLDGLAEDVVLSVRGLDDRLSGYEVLAIEPPAVLSLQVRCRYPEYLRDPQNTSDAPDLIVDYAPGLRIREGSDLTLIARSSKPLSEATFMLRGTDFASEVQTAQVAEDRMSFSLALPNFNDDCSLLLLPADELGIRAVSPSRFFLGVVKDQAPAVSLNLVGIGSAITPVAKIPFKGTATDDYELSRIEMAIAPATQNANKPVLRNVKPERDGSFSGSVDLRTLVTDDVMQSLSPGERLNLFAEATDRFDLGDRHITQSDLYGLDVVSAEELLGRLERRELGLRGRLEQSIDEIRQLRDVLSKIANDDWQVPASATAIIQEEQNEADRALQLRVLRIQQSSLQAAKTGEELSGIAVGLKDIIAEMENNRVDSVDRRERIAEQVQQPLEDAVTGELKDLRTSIDSLQLAARDPATGPELATRSVDAAEELLLRLTSILDSMLDLESYNEILDIVRDIINRQDELIDDTKEEQKRRVLDLFKP